MLNTHSQLNKYLESIGEQVITEANLGSPNETGDEFVPPTHEQAENAAKILISSMKIEEKNRNLLLYAVLGFSLLWFILCAWVIIYMTINNYGITATTSAFGIDALGLAMLLPFLSCLHESKVKSDVFLAVFPSIDPKGRAEFTRQFYLELKENRCDFGRSVKK